MSNSNTDSTNGAGLSVIIIFVIIFAVFQRSSPSSHASPLRDHITVRLIETGPQVLALTVGVFEAERNG